MVLPRPKGLNLVLPWMLGLMSPLNPPIVELSADPASSIIPIHRLLIPA